MRVSAAGFLAERATFSEGPQRTVTDLWRREGDTQAEAVMTKMSCKESRTGLFFQLRYTTFATNRPNGSYTGIH